jgi:hypothetical protein
MFGVVKFRSGVQPKARVSCRNPPNYSGTLIILLKIIFRWFNRGGQVLNLQWTIRHTHSMRTSLNGQ